MCCFSTKTEVHGTTIFARLKKPGTQVLAYRMLYSAATPTAMILPVPVALPAREDSLRFVNLRDYPTLFTDLERGFPEISRSRNKSAAVAAGPSTLVVHDVGDFVASFVPSVADFGRVDPRFVLSRSVWDKIPASKDYGFAVFQLKELSGSPHPIAFEFDTRLDGTLFFPTVHIHDGSVHDKDHFDHTLYLQASAFDERASSYAGPEAVDDRTGLVRSEGKAKGFADVARSQGLLDPELLVHKITMRGLLPNRDTFYDFHRAMAPAQGCARCDAGSAASDVTSGAAHVGMTVAALGWIIRRRDALRARRPR